MSTSLFNRTVKTNIVLYKSDGNRRFGGYASQCWKSKGNSIEDNNCFLSNSRSINFAIMYI